MSHTKQWVLQQAALVYEHGALADVIIVEYNGETWQKAHRQEDALAWSKVVEDAIEMNLNGLTQGTHYVKLTAMIAETDEVLATTQVPYRGRVAGRGSEKQVDGNTELAKAFASMTATTEEMMNSARNAIQMLGEEAQQYRELCFKQQATMMTLLAKDRETDLKVFRSEQATKRMEKALDVMGPELSNSLGELLGALTSAIQKHALGGEIANEPVQSTVSDSSDKTGIPSSSSN